MVTRPRPTGPPSDRPRPVQRPVYRDFQPDFEWKQEDGSAVLRVNLPGFVKEQIRILSVDPNRVRIRGMRPAASNTWIRFDQTFLVPEDSTTTETKAKFQDGVLELQFPKKVKNVGSQEKQARPTQQTPLSPLRPPAAQVTDSVPPKPFPSAAPQQQREGNQTQLPSPPPVPPPAAAATSGGDGKPVEAPRKPKSEIEMDERIGQKPAIAPTQDQIQTDAKRAKDTHLGKATAPSVASNIQREAKNIEKAAAGQDLEKPTAAKKSEEAPEKPLHQKMQIESEESKLTTTGGAEKKSQGIEPESVIKKRVGKEKTAGPAAGVDQKAVIDQQSNAADIGRSAQYAVIGSKFEKYKQMVKDFITPKDEEERKLLVNIGVAAMVIIALGAYITYSHSSSQKYKQQ